MAACASPTPANPDAAGPVDAAMVDASTDASIEPSIDASVDASIEPRLLGDGAVCSADEACASAHCENGFCCASGDCCALASDCPPAYSTDPVCGLPTVCQGTADQAQCTNNRCTTVPAAPDDSACVSVADTCDLYPSITCSGAVEQSPPACATSCAAPADCDASGYCKPTNECGADEPTGTTCSLDGDCQSGHCASSTCCTQSVETCNGVDDDCDEVVDNDTDDPHEPNAACDSALLPEVVSDATWTITNPTLSPGGDTDHFTIHARETDATCSCGGLSDDEDYNLTVSVGVPLTGVSVYFCAARACGDIATYCVSVNPGSVESWTFALDGSCSAVDEYDVHVRVNGGNASRCGKYTLSYNFDAGFCR